MSKHYIQLWLFCFFLLSMRSNKTNWYAPPSTKSKMLCVCLEEVNVFRQVLINCSTQRNTAVLTKNYMFLICFLSNKNKTWKKPTDSWTEKIYFPYCSPIKYCKLLDENSTHNLLPYKQDKDLQRFHLLIWPTEILETDDAAVLESFGDFLPYVLIVWVSLSKETTLPLQSSPWVVS